MSITDFTFAMIVNKSFQYVQKVIPDLKELARLIPNHK